MNPALGSGVMQEWAKRKGSRLEPHPTFPSFKMTMCS